MKKLLVVLSLVSLCLLESCSSGDETLQPKNQELQNYLASSSFVSLNVSEDLLDLSRSNWIKSKSNKDVLYAPFIGKENTFLLAFSISENDYYSTIVTFENVNSISNLEEAFRNQELSGNFRFQSVDNSYSFSLVDSKLISVTEEYESGRSAACGGMTGTLACAAKSIDSMGPFSYTACLIEIIVCLAVEMADCAYSGCA